MKKLKAIFQLIKIGRLLMKSRGVKTSEFWLTILSSLVTMFQAIQGNLDPTLATIIGAVLTAVYTIGRSLAKKGEAETEKK